MNAERVATAIQLPQPLPSEAGPVAARVGEELRRGQDRPEGWGSLSAVANVHRCVGAAGAGVFGGDILAVVKNTSLP